MGSMLNLLEPLSEATKLLCASNYPTPNLALPQHLDDQEQLIMPAHEMIDHYLKEAMHKSIYITAMILDPTFKMMFWKNHEQFIQEYYVWSYPCTCHTCVLQHSRTIWPGQDYQSQSHLASRQARKNPSSSLSYIMYIGSK
ncbi:uncharacterized protein VP01_2653g4 [Puccinia sorghi]|uniref:hAT-like transposase RNase-H fold domain-containing protein n=1 Tax=Puccinia sorghi TaxID=27349 RepID=A0A0L6V5Z3_9BASI|nr:uncharacterized protein VP01_2653g4 [Puccinia sorghi]